MVGETVVFLVEACRAALDPEFSNKTYHCAPAYSRCTVRTVRIRNIFGNDLLTTEQVLQYGPFFGNKCSPIPPGGGQWTFVVVVVEGPGI